VSKSALVQFLLDEACKAYATDSKDLDLVFRGQFVSGNNSICYIGASFIKQPFMLLTAKLDAGMICPVFIELLLFRNRINERKTLKICLCIFILSLLILTHHPLILAYEGDPFADLPVQGE